MRLMKYATITLETHEKDSPPKDGSKCESHSVILLSCKGINMAVNDSKWQ